MKAVRAMVVIAALLIAWELVCRLLHISAAILPPPTQVAVKWVDYLTSGELPRDALATLFRIAVGFVIGAGLALPLGLWMGASGKVYEVFNPLIQILRPIPPIAFIPLAILWFGLGNPPSFFLIALGAFFPVLINTIAGVRNVDAIYVRAAQNLGAPPAVLFGIGVAFICVIVAEMIAVNNGLGYRILEAREYFWSDKILAGMISIGVLGLAIDVGMARLNQRLLRWHRGLENA